MKNWIRIFAFGLLSTSSASWAADQDDMYVEASVGSNLKLSSEMLSELSFGYLPLDGLGGGLYVAQEFVGAERYSALVGSLVGLELRWFLEPFEVDVSAGRLIHAAGSQSYMHMGAAYLHALTPSMAAKFETRARLVFGDQWVIFSTLGARILF